MKIWIIAAAAIALAVPAAVAAHPGGLNAEGCHNDRKNGGYHCHRESSGSRSSSRSQGLRSQTPSSGRAYANCSEARAAGAAPVRQSDPGYGRHLDRDGDGVGCE